MSQDEAVSEARARYVPGQRITSGLVYRRIFPAKNYFDPASRKPTSVVFDKGKRPHLSVALAELTTPEQVLAGAPTPGYGLCSIDIATLVQCGLQVTFTPDKDDPAHVSVEGNPDKSTRRELARAAEIIVAPVLTEAQ